MSRPYFCSSFGGGNNWSFIHPKGCTTQMAPSNAVPPQSTPAPISEYVGLRALGMKPIKELPCLAPAIALLSTTSSPLSSCRAHKLPHVFTKPVGFLCRFSISQLLPPLLASSSPQIAPVQMLTYFLKNFLASNQRTPSAATEEKKSEKSEGASIPQGARDIPGSVYNRLITVGHTREPFVCPRKKVLRLLFATFLEVLFSSTWISTFKIGMTKIIGFLFYCLSGSSILWGIEV